MSTTKGSKLGKEKYKKYSLRRKGASGIMMLESSLVFKEMKSLKKHMIVYGKKGSGNLSARPHWANPTTC